MSHFTIAVLTEDPNSLDEILAPYNEQPNDNSEFLQFDDHTEELKAEWEELKIDDMNERRAQIALGTCEYSSIEEYAKEYHNYIEDPKNPGRWGWMHNPNAKWDWYTIGGRWTGLLHLKEGASGRSGRPGALTEPNTDPSCADIALLKDVDFEKMFNADKQRAEEIWAKNEKGEITGMDLYLADIQPNDTRETFMARTVRHAPTWSFIPPNGKWTAPGQMGWWACTDANADTYIEYDKAWKETLSKLDHSKTYIIIVDCHI